MTPFGAAWEDRKGEKGVFRRGKGGAK